jgi:hypothetical protein
MANTGTLTGEELAQQQQISRQQKMAEMLLQQGLQQPQGQMVSGHYVAPSLFQNLAGLANVYMGQKGLEKADKAQTDLAERLRIEGDKDLMAYGQAVKRIPEQTVYGAGMEGPTMDVTPAVEPDYAKGMSILRRSKDPETRQLAKMLMADQMKTIVAPEGSTIYRGGISGAGETIKGSPKKTSDIQNYEYDVANSGFKGTFNEWLTGQKKAGASNQIMNAGKDFTGQVGDIGKESRIATMGAVQTADAANRIIQAVDSNKLFTGVGANQRLTAAQLADGLGLGGKDTTQKINNSRQAMQGLAQLTLQGRKQMRGEGAITQSEGELAERAMSGEINFTAGEIRQLAEAAKRSAKFQYDMHQNIINTMRADPTTKGLIPYFDVPADVNIFNPRAVGAQSDIRKQADEIIGGSKR